jgi:hypothetical protein
MMEQLSKKVFQTALMPGATVHLQLEHEDDIVLTGVMADWSGKSCQVNVTSKGELPALSPEMQLQVICTRMDGIFCAPGVVVDLDVSDFPRAHRGDFEKATIPFYSCNATIAIDFHQARRIQNRSFFRVAGSWEAHIACPVAEIEEESIYHHARVRNLSANGILLEDFHGVLSLGCRFRILLELEDGKQPLCQDAVALRLDTSHLGTSPMWGCSFAKAEDDNETRIVRTLNERIRSRWAVQPGA